MEERKNPQRRSPRPKTKFEIFKEEKLPLVIAAAAGVLILIFIIGSISNAVQRNRIEKEQEAAEMHQLEQERKALDALVKENLPKAELAAKQYDYDTAIALLEPFQGHTEDYPAVASALRQYQAEKETLVAWDDPGLIPNLSFQILIADPQAAFSDEDYGSAFNRNYVTTGEFTAILEQLYQNGYVLVGLEDVYTKSATEDGAAAYMAGTIYLPEGKKPLMLTQTNVNYDQYLVDKNKDGDLTDGRGFAAKLMIENGKAVNQLTDRSGNTVTGAYDLIPILENFVAAHPDFSYRGAKAVIAVSGHEGLFGYRTNDKKAENYYAEVNQAATVAQWLRENGYQLACYTYANTAYGGKPVSEIRADLEKWDAEVTTILGETDILVFAQRSDIQSDTGAYSGGPFEILMDNGFRYYLGICNSGSPWSRATTQYVRQGRIMVSGATLANHSRWFGGMFDAGSVLDSSRGTVPSW